MATRTDDATLEVRATLENGGYDSGWAQGLVYLDFLRHGKTASQEQEG